MIKKTFVLSLLVLLGACSEPDFYDASGEPVYRTRLHEKIVVLNYWATWCAPCIAEIPELNELAKEEAERLVVLGVNFDDVKSQDLTTAIKKMKIDFPVAAGQVHETFGVALPQVLPTTYIFSAGGELKQTLVGPQTRASILTALE